MSAEVVAAIEERAAEVVEAAPELSAEQRDALVSLLVGAA